MNRFVLDASVALAWLVQNPIPTYASRVEKLLLNGGRGIVPALWHVEMANGLVMAERHGTLTATDIDATLVRMEALVLHAIETVVDVVPARQNLMTARISGLTAYDAVYLNLARQEQIPIASLDRRLNEAAKRGNVVLV